TPSVGLHARRNIARCFVCDPKALSPIDLVMTVLEVDFRSALNWISDRYAIPNAPKGKRIGNQERWPDRFHIRPGLSLQQELVRCGVWAEFCPTHKIPLVCYCPACRGEKTSERKALSSRKNGKLGGRPRRMGSGKEEK